MSDKKNWFIFLWVASTLGLLFINGNSIVGECTAHDNYSMSPLSGISCILIIFRNLGYLMLLTGYLLSFYYISSKKSEKESYHKRILVFLVAIAILLYATLNMWKIVNL